MASRVADLSDAGRRVLGALVLADRPLPVHVVAQALDLDAEGSARALFYDPPWTLPWFRRNEVAIEMPQVP